MVIVTILLVLPTLNLIISIKTSMPWIQKHKWVPSDVDQAFQTVEFHFTDMIVHKRVKCQKRSLQITSIGNNFVMEHSFPIGSGNFYNEMKWNASSTCLHDLSFSFATTNLFQVTNIELLYFDCFVQPFHCLHKVMTRHREPKIDNLHD